MPLRGGAAYRLKEQDMKLRVSVNGQQYEVEVEVLEEPAAGRPAPVAVAPSAPIAPPAPPVVPQAPAPAAVAAGAKVMNARSGDVVEIHSKPGQAVKRGDRS